MGSKYTSQAASGYNASPPSDDGTASEANKVKWSTIKTKLADVVKTLAEGINTALVTALDHSARSVTASDTAAASDNERTIEVKTSSVNITLSDAATMAAGYIVSVANQSSGPITVSLATTTDTIDMVTNATGTIQAYETRRYIVNAAANGYITAGAETKGYVLIRKQTASSSASIDFTAGITSAFDEYVITCSEVVAGTDATDLYVRVSQDGGSTFKSGASDYKYGGNISSESAANTAYGSTGAGAIIAAFSLGTATGEAGSGTIRFFNPSGSSKYKQFLTDFASYNSGPSQGTTRGSGSLVLNTNAVNGVRLLMSSGNIASGTFSLYGVRKS